MGKKIALVFVLFLCFSTVLASSGNLQASVRVVQKLNGDVNGDCKVDIFDLAIIGMCYRCEEGQSCWNNCQRADLNNDGIVNIFDLSIVGMNYGKEC